MYSLDLTYDSEINADKTIFETADYLGDFYLPSFSLELKNIYLVKNKFIFDKMCGYDSDFYEENNEKVKIISEKSLKNIANTTVSKYLEDKNIHSFDFNLTDVIDLNSWETKKVDELSLLEKMLFIVMITPRNNNKNIYFIDLESINLEDEDKLLFFTFLNQNKKNNTYFLIENSFEILNKFSFKYFEINDEDIVELI